MHKGTSCSSQLKVTVASASDAVVVKIEPGSRFLKLNMSVAGKVGTGFHEHVSSKSYFEKLFFRDGAGLLKY